MSNRSYSNMERKTDGKMETSGMSNEMKAWLLSCIYLIKYSYTWEQQVQEVYTIIYCIYKYIQQEPRNRKQETKKDNWMKILKIKYTVHL